MPSTYTVNLGLEKVASGEKAGEWGNSLNTSLDSIDTAVNGAVDINLPGTGTSGTPNYINIIDGTGTGSLGRNKYINVTDSGDLGGSAYLALSPNDAEKIAWIKNSLSGSRDLILFQGTYNASNDLVVAAGKAVLAKFDGGGAGAIVTNVLSDIVIEGATINGTNTIDGATVTSDFDLPDNTKINFGTGNDLQIYHDNSFVIDKIASTASSGLQVNADSGGFYLKHNTEDAIQSSVNGGVRLYHNNVEKLETTSTGIELTGNINGTGSVDLPSGLESQRPFSPTKGTIRYNSSDEMLEVYKGNYDTTISDAWRPITGFELITTGSGSGTLGFTDIIHKIDRDSTANGRTPYSYVEYKLVLQYYSSSDHAFYIYPIYVIADGGSVFTASTSYSMNYTGRNFNSYYSTTQRNQTYIYVNRYGDLIDAYASVTTYINWTHTLNTDSAPIHYNGGSSYVSFNYTGEEQISNFQGNTLQQADYVTIGFRPYVTNGTATYAWALYGLRQVQT